MIKSFAQRPASKHRSNMRPITGKASEENEKLSNECFQTGKKHMGKKQYDQAIKHYVNATIHNPYNFKALSNLGSLYKTLNKFSEARSCYHKAIFANPSDHIAIYNLGNLQRISGNDEQAIVLYQKVISLKEKQNVEIGSLHYDALINQGICYKNLQLYDFAIQCNDKAIKINQKDEPAYFNKSMCLLKKIYDLSKSNFVSVKKKLCQQGVLLFKKVLQINQKSLTSKVALIQLKYLSDNSQQIFNQCIKEFQNLLKTVSQSEKYQIQFKIKYCQNQLKKLSKKTEEQNNQDKIQKPSTASNQYENQQRKGLKTPLQKQKRDNAETKNKQNKVEKIDQAEKLEKIDKAEKANKVQKDIKTTGSQKETDKNIPKTNVQVPQKLKQDVTSIKNNIDKLIEQKNYNQAFQIAKLLPDGIQKYETQIIINYLQFLQKQQESLLQSANLIYRQYILKNDEDKPINKQTCSQKGHQYIATMLNVLGDFTQASKHYQALLDIIQDQKFGASKNIENQDKIKQIHAQLGVCYAERGLLSQAIKEYEKSFIMQPDNYFLMTNLCGLLIRNDQKKEARKYYQDYLNKINIQKMEDKTSYIDSLLNISICERDTPEEDEALRKAIEALQKYFPTYQQIRTKLHQQAVLGMYLRQAEILQNKSQSMPQNTQQKKQIYGKMLDVYLTCLQFQNCPDREAISINSGILFYLNGCYANALNFYRTVVLNRKVIANNLGLTFLHLQQYQRSLSCLSVAVENSPNNVVYVTNYQIVRWMCGLNQINNVEIIPCKCQALHDLRQSFALWMLQQLTNMIDSDQIQIQKLSADQAKVQSQILIKKLVQKSKSKAGFSELNKNKIGLIRSQFDKHIAEYHKQGKNQEKILQFDYVPSQIKDICMKRCQNQKQFSENCQKAIQFVHKFAFNPQRYHTITQATLCSLFVANTHIQKADQLFRQVVRKLKIYNSEVETQKLETSEYKKQQNNFVSKKFSINNPNIRLQYKLLNNLIRDTQCVVQNLCEFLVQHIQRVYYSDTQKIILPISRQYRLPHCQNVSECMRCMLSSSNLYCSLFRKKIFPSKIPKLQKYEEQIKKFDQSLKKFVQNNLINQTNGVFSKQKNEIVVKLQSKNEPIVLRSHHKKFKDLKQFVGKIDPSFKLQDQSQDKGIKQIMINNCLLLELWWGEKATYLDRFCQWICRRNTNYYYDALLLFGQDLDKYNTNK